MTSAAAAAAPTAVDDVTAALPKRTPHTLSPPHTRLPSPPPPACLQVVRAAASAKSEHRGGLCFLAKLGIRIGKACGTLVGGPGGGGAHIYRLMPPEKTH